MKKIVLVFGLVVFSLVVLAGSAPAADKLAYVNLSKVFSEYKKTKDYDKVLEEKEKVYTTDREKKLNDIKQLQDKINLLSDKEKQTKKTDIESKVKDLQEFDRQKQTDLRKDQDEKMKEILKDIEEAIKEYSVSQGYTLVFNDRVLVYEDTKLDITDKIIEFLSKSSKK